MTEEFDLSKNECNILTNHINVNDWSTDLINGKTIIKLPKEELKFEKGYMKEDIKEFIRRLKEEIKNHGVVSKSMGNAESIPKVLNNSEKDMQSGKQGDMRKDLPSKTTKLDYQSADSYTEPSWKIYSQIIDKLAGEELSK